MVPMISVIAKKKGRDCSSSSSFRGARSASYDVQLHIGESITTIVSMDSGPAPKKAHPGMTRTEKAGIAPGLLFLLSKKVVDGRVKPGHDEVGRTQFEARFGGDAGHDLISVS
jgi:hypothetical protein